VGAYVLRRLLYGIPILLGITIVTFLLFHVVGGDPARMLAGKMATPERLAEIRHELGTDRPLAAQYLQFLGETFTFEFGRSWQEKRPVSERSSPGWARALAGGPRVLRDRARAGARVVLRVLPRHDRGPSIVVAAVAGISVPSLAYIIFGSTSSRSSGRCSRSSATTGCPPARSSCCR
jgi:peptide/nickel transport system permease protein